MQQKQNAWVALGVICFSISVTSYLNSLQARTRKLLNNWQAIAKTLDRLPY
ncbi:hypothetical protein [Aliterella atlantica]|uniref:hypothetical protein n=1 Tax=Aliterella atlantica TaxID=1827278 RepID=UPI001364B7C2|nr:hypothetical protein [Aliterella atlantica]